MVYRSHLYGPSYRNQRIEAWWSILRRCWSQIWINLFDDLISFGVYRPADIVHRGVADFCFMRIIKKELSDYVEYWNRHYVRRTRTSGCPGGIPQELYDLPGLLGFSNKIVRVNQNEVGELFSEAVTPVLTSSDSIWELCDELLIENEWDVPQTRQEATNLYVEIISRVGSSTC